MREPRPGDRVPRLRSGTRHPRRRHPGHRPELIHPAHALLPQGVRSPFIIGLLIGAVLVAIAAYFLLPEPETTITRDVRSEELRRTISVVRPFVRDLKDFKELKK